MDNIEDLIQEIRNGRMVILVDDEDRENEGDLVLGADFVTPENINFMATHAKGLICLAITGEQSAKLNLPLMVADSQNDSPHQTAFTVSIEASEGVSTGISAADRAHTIRVAANGNAKATDVITPGHVFPIVAKKGGVLTRTGHTEGSVDLSKLAGLSPSAVICEVMNEDGTMARVPELKKFAKKYDLKIGTIESLIRYRLRHEVLVKEVISRPFNSEFGNDLKIRVFENKLSSSHNLVIQKGEIKADDVVTVRVQVGNILSDIFADISQPKHSRLKDSIKMISKLDSGIVVYLMPKTFQEGLVADLLSGKSKTRDQREYGIGAQILRSLGVKKIKLISNNPTNKIALKGYGLEIIEQVPLYEKVINEKPVGELDKL